MKIPPFDGTPKPVTSERNRAEIIKRYWKKLGYEVHVDTDERQYTSTAQSLLNGLPKSKPEWLK